MKALKGMHKIGRWGGTGKILVGLLYHSVTSTLFHELRAIALGHVALSLENGLIVMRLPWCF